MSDKQARGTFQVQLAPQDAELDGAAHRFGITKSWAGDVSGDGDGVMVSGGDPARGDAGYVAIEVVHGTVHGRRGTFLLQQFGDLDEGRETLYYQVVNGSGTGELVGLRGRMDIDIDDEGTHHYTLDYQLPG